MKRWFNVCLKVILNYLHRTFTKLNELIFSFSMSSFSFCFLLLLLFFFCCLFHSLFHYFSFLFLFLSFLFLLSFYSFLFSFSPSFIFFSSLIYNYISIYFFLFYVFLSVVVKHGIKPRLLYKQNIYSLLSQNHSQSSIIPALENITFHLTTRSIYKTQSLYSIFKPH